MANKSSAKKKGKKENSTDTAATKEDKPTTIHEDIESLQITFYEIESWIEKTSPLLTRMTKELDKASGHFEKKRKGDLDQQLVPLGPQLWKPTTNLLCQNSVSTAAASFSQSTTIDSSNPAATALSTNNTLIEGKDSQMQWILSFQPGNLLRLDTNITSVEQLVEAVQKIRLTQSEELGIAATTTTNTTEMEDDDHMSVEVHSYPSSNSTLAVSSTASSTLASGMHDPSTNTTTVEYWTHAIHRRPKVSLENYKHDAMNLTHLTQDVTVDALDYIGQIFWDCLHPKFSSNWDSLWDRSGDPKRNQVCIDSGLAMIFLHINRHDKDICENSQAIAGFYFDRARAELMDFFDMAPDCSTIETLLNLSMFSTVCKTYSQARIYLGLCLNMMLELGINRPSRLPENIYERKNYLKLLLILYYNDYMLSVHLADLALISDSEFYIDFYDIIKLNETILEENKSKPVMDQYNFDNNKTIVKESYFVHTVELLRVSKKVILMSRRCVPMKQLLTQERRLNDWFNRLPISLLYDKQENYSHFEHEKTRQDNDHTILRSLDADTLGAQARLLLKISYEAQWIILHKAILNSIRYAYVSAGSIVEQEIRSSAICAQAADTIVELAELVTKCFGWCVLQQVISCLYQASTVYCSQALVKDNPELKNKARLMILRIMKILDEGSVTYEGFPDDMTECLCEFLIKHGMNHNVECSCSGADETTAFMLMGTPNSAYHVGHGSTNTLYPTHKHTKRPPNQRTTSQSNKQT